MYEHALARILGVSRTTSRKVLARLAAAGLIHVTERHVAPGRPPAAKDYFPQVETLSSGQQVERKFMEWIFHADTRPGTVINEHELARIFGVSAGPLREYLTGFSRYGLVEKKPSAEWLFRGFTKDFALDLFEVRTMFEMHSIKRFTLLPPNSPLWTDLAAVRAEHLALAASPGTDLSGFCALDDRFHRLVAACAPNRFITDFHGIISLIFHYHYQWNRRTEQARNGVALREHLAIIDALLARDCAGAQASALAHLDTARTTLLQAVGVGPRMVQSPARHVSRAAR